MKTMTLCALLAVLFFSFANINSYAGNTPQKKDSPLQQATALYKIGQKQQAEILLVNFLKTAQHNNKALIYQSYITLADIYSRRTALAKQKKTLESLKQLLNQWGFKKTTEMVRVKRLLAKNNIRQGNELKGIKELASTLRLAQQVFPANSIELSQILIPLARAHINRLETKQAESYLQQADKLIASHADKKSQLILSNILQLRGELLFRQGKTAMAENLYRQTLSIRQSLTGKTSLATGQSTIALAGALKGLHLFTESEELYRQGFAIYEQHVGLDHPFIATLLNNLGQLYYLQGRFAESEAVLQRALSIKLKHYPANHISIAETNNHLGYLYYLLKQDDKAIKSFQTAIDIWALKKSYRPRYSASAQTWLAVIQFHQGHALKAEKKLQTILTTLIKTYGENNVATTQVYHHLALIHLSLKHYKQAEKLFLKGLKAAGQFGQNDWLEQILINSELARFYLQQNRKNKALQQSRLAIQGLKQRIQRNSGLRAQSLTTELKSLKQVALTHIDILYAQIKHHKKPQNLINESFATAQISRASSTARALANMAQRFSSGSNQLAKIIKQHQAYLQNWQEVDAILSSFLAKPIAQRNIKEEQRLRDYAAEIKEKIKQLNQQISKQFPNYNNLTSMSAISINEVQQNLKPEEALINYVFGQKNSYLWVIKKTSAAIYPLNITTDVLADTVKKLRQKLVPRFLEVSDINLIPPLPVEETYKLFEKILQPAYDSLKEQTHLIVIADGALQSLPLSILITEPPVKINKPSDHKKIHWLILDKSYSALPAVNSLILLRQINHIRPKAKLSFIGFGDPSLVEAVRKISLRSKQLKMRGATTLRSIIGSSRSAVSIDILAEMPELPETATEIKEIAHILKGAKKDIFLRDNATEQILHKQRLQDYRIVQFATHGLMAGDFEGLFEPALVMTPSLFALDSKNNGLLTASEIAQLELNSDLVVLSACNTAAADGTPGAEGLSGLGKAFFHAGSQRLLVTHWEVLSEATVTMTINLFTFLKEQPQLSVAAAHRLATLKLMNNKNKNYAHPMFWAPFMIVGAE